MAGDTLNLLAGDTWHETFFPKGNGTPTNWITMQAYGAGAAPIIDGDSTREFGIRFDNTLFRGGWKILGIKVQNCLTAGFDAEAAVGFPSGLWLENCVADACTGPLNGGAALTANTNTSYPAGFMLSRIKNFTIKNCTATNCGVGMFGMSVDTGTITNFNISGCGYAAAALQALDNNANWNIGGTGKYSKVLSVSWTGGVVTNNSSSSKPDGHVSIFCFGTQDCTFDGVEISFTRKPFAEPDGTAFDLEGGCINTTIKNCNIHDNEGAAILHASNLFAFTPNQGQNSGTVVDNCIINNNGTNAPASIPAFFRSSQTTDAVSITNCTITRANPATQKIFGLVNGGLTDTPPPAGGVAWTYPIAPAANGNTITN